MWWCERGRKLLYFEKKNVIIKSKEYMKWLINEVGCYEKEKNMV